MEFLLFFCHTILTKIIREKKIADKKAGDKYRI
jgi:hypothetical protein